MQDKNYIEKYATDQLGGHEEVIKCRASREVKAPSAFHITATEEATKRMHSKRPGEDVDDGGC